MVEAAQEAAAPPAPRPLPARAALPMAIAAGLTQLLAFPRYDLWWLAPVSVALLAAAVHRRRARAGAGLGLITGLVFFGPLLEWTNLHTGVLPWVLLFVAEALFIALLGAAAAYASPLVDRHRWTWPLLTGLLWVGQEAARDRTPFGGFPWGRLAFSQGDSPALRFAALGGAPLVTFVVALIGGLLVAAAWPRGGWARRGTPAKDGSKAGTVSHEPVEDGSSPSREPAQGRPLGGPAWRRPGRASVLLGAGAIALAAAGLLVPVGGSASGPPVRFAIVQGNVPRLGLDFNAQRRAVLDNHVNGTVELAGRVTTGQAQQPDLVIWPENSSDVDPFLDPQAAAEISRAADSIKAPILVGAVLRGPGENQVRNAGVVWLPGQGPDESRMYIKRHPVPFAEYIPLRNIARMVSKEVDRVRSDFVAGTTPGVLDMGPATVGDVICFEVAYDGIVRDTVTGGAGILAVQTNNATFDESEARQQLAMVRLRAVEHGRDALMASTVGVSGFVGTDGSVRQETGFNTPGVLVAEMTPRATRTLATQLGYWPEMVLSGLAVAALVAATVIRRRPVHATPSAIGPELSTSATPQIKTAADEAGGTRTESG
ncbi:apolipoprotein N-acyltransferase [Asanoa ferruginea]|uniref:Apolipoprotein N-acyltransferase n=1 Tax=Asanoa ferruginea TaxID=53367 RepID=A0A3D9ZWX6_9ACTN|nr:apolipoprotein N-acyltransferase [Asanoa ferruginea]